MKSLADEALEIAAKATPGPWHVNESLYNSVWKTGGCQIMPAQIHVTGTSTFTCSFEYIESSKDDAEFIAFSREALPELARRLKIACQALRDIHTQLDSTWTDSALDELVEELEAPLGDTK